MSPPPLPPGYDEHLVVYLEAVHCPPPKMSFPHKLVTYQRTTPAQVAERIKDATIVISTVVPVTSSDLNGAPNLQLLAILATGMGWLDREDAANRGITVVNCPQSNVESVGEHFLALYFASRRRVPEIHRRVTETSEWVDKGTLMARWTQGPPLSCANETLGIIGYGALGKRFEHLAKGVGFGKINIADRKDTTTVKEGRVSFEEVITTSTTIVLCCPFAKETINLIDERELKMMKRECLVINMARGGIVNEPALVAALREGRIYGAATDVLEGEPVNPGSSPLLPDITNGGELVPNLIVSPHIAWFSQKTLENLVRLLTDGINCFANGTLDEEYVKGNVVVRDGKVVRW